MSELLEQSGYSYSGISNIMRSNPEKAKQFLTELDKEYSSAIKRTKELTDELDKLKGTRGMLVSCFYYAHRSLNLLDKPLAFANNESIVVVKIVDPKIPIIDYESIPLSAF